jgi:hypothetical protein
MDVGYGLVQGGKCHQEEDADAMKLIVLYMYVTR